MKKITSLWLVSCITVSMLFSCTGCEIVLGGDTGDGDSQVENSVSVGAESIDENNKQVSGDITQQSESKAIEGAPVGAKSLYVTGSKESIALRASDQDNAEVVALLSVGDEVKLLSGDSVSYYYVMYEPGNVNGYIKKTFVTTEKAAVCKGETFYISKQTLLYDTNESDRKEIQKLNVGTAVTVLAKNPGDYWYISLSDSKTYGFVKCLDLSASKPASSAAASSKASSSKAAASSQAAQPAPAPAPAVQNNRFTGYGSAPANYTTYYAKVNSGYLALRSTPERANDTNVIGQMYTGYAVYVVDTSPGTYWYAYCPTLGMYGYTDSNYLLSYYPGNTNQTTTSTDYTVWTVQVASGYLAMRSSPERANDTNVTGQLYSGDTVRVYSYSYTNFTDVYWYVYSPKLGMWGYVNSNYIYS